MNPTKTKHNSIKQPRRNAARHGALAVEIALCLPILMLFLFGCYEIARANMISHATESAAYEASRVGVVPGATEEKIRVAAEFVLNSVGVSEFDLVVEPSVITSQTPSVRVDVVVPFDKNTSIPQFFIKDPNFRASTELTRDTF